MEFFSRSTFGVARTLMALAVFFCHVFRPFNDFGFLFVGVFFFMSGYGMECSGLRYQALRRSLYYLVFLFFFTLVYWVVYRVFPYPSSWFLYVYLAVMVMYRFLPRRLLLWAFLALGFVMLCLGFNWVWCASYGAFLFGMFFARNESAFTFSNCLLFVPGFLLMYFGVSMGLWCLIPVFAWIVLRISGISFLRNFAWLGQYTFFFYCVHCFFLGLFRSTWTLGGSPSIYGVFMAFLCSCACSWLFYDRLFSNRR